jgi:prolyl oligopeptidase
MSMFRMILISAFALVIVAAAFDVRAVADSATAAQTTVAKAPPGWNPDVDPYLWLEQVHGARAMTWVDRQDALSTKAIESYPSYRLIYDESVKLFETKDRIPYPETIGGQIYNFWNDKTHVKGILRRTTFGDYLTSSPHWTTVFDFDALARSEKKNWVYEGLQCDFPAESRCLISLSDGGEDAISIREVDLPSAKFVDGGFTFGRAKQTPAWLDANTLLVSRPWTPGELTTSGYPYDIRLLKRGQAEADAVEVFKGAASDVSASPFVVYDGQGHRAMMIVRSLDFFNSDYYFYGASGVHQVALPEQINILGLLDGLLVIQLNQPWTIGGKTFPADALVSMDLSALESDPAHPHPTTIYAPGSRESFGDIAITKDRLLVMDYVNVLGRALDFAPAADGTWTSSKLPLPVDSTISIADENLHDDTAFLDVENFLTPATLYRVNAVAGTASAAKALPAQFNAANDIVEQHEARSKDGTMIPYFVVRPKAMRFDGMNPTVLNAYGGFQISSTPAYNSGIGKLWLERGGVFVLANIRGGGEFGSAWHDAGLKTHRQRIYDDFYAVAQDLVARKITCPRRLGITGASNGGLLMGVEFTQHPEMYDAVDIGIPLLDMMRYERIEAGASWVGEYGSVSVPAERAFLRSISPYQNLRPGTAYPEPYIWTTTKDDRVGPEAARKFAARLESMGVPTLFYEVTAGGHGYGADLGQDAQSYALEWTYLNMRLMPGG